VRIEACCVAGWEGRRAAGVEGPIDLAAGPIVAVAGVEDPIAGCAEAEGVAGMNLAEVRRIGVGTARPSTAAVSIAAVGRDSRSLGVPGQESQSILSASPCLSRRACRRFLACWTR
jgi:hypothetical protein